MIRLGGARSLWVSVSLALASVLVLASGARPAAGARKADDGIGRLALPRAGQKVVILAPHPDDETLGCGGLIQQCIGGGVGVHVVVVTNGEYSQTLVQHLPESRVERPEAFEELGTIRQQETLMAVGLLGVPRSQVTFLGYPNHFLEDMYSAEHWLPNNPVRSMRLNTTQSPYPNSLTPRALFCGQSIMRDLKEVLLREKPGMVLLPHPSDIHHDHWAVFALTTFALEELAAGGERWARQCRAYTYLVHREGWPTPRGYQPEASLTPPQQLLLLSRWEALPLSKAEAIRKGQAISLFVSQKGDREPFLRSFARRNELFAAAESLAWPADKLVFSRRIITDPAQGLRAVTRDAAADILSVRLGRSQGRMLVTVSTRGRVDSGVSYHFSIHSGGAEERDRVIGYYEWRGDKASAMVLEGEKLRTLPSAELHTQSKGHSATLKAPWPLLSERSRFLLARAWTTRNKEPRDRTQVAVARIR